MADYILDGETLTVHGELLNQEFRHFQEWCNKLMESPASRITIDLSEVSRIHSTCISVLLAILVESITQKRELQLKASPKVKQLLTTVGFDKLFNIAD